MKIVAPSDTHNLHEQMTHPVPGGDVLIHAGDLTNRGSLSDISSFAEWSKYLPHCHKLVIAGNHDFCFDPDHPKRLYSAKAAEILSESGWTYLKDETHVIDGTTFYGSPWQPWFYDWAFNLERGEEIAQVWKRIPNNTQVLITHGPPYGILDATSRGKAVGCEELLKRVKSIRPRLHLFGHIHEAYGTKEIDGTIYGNASICSLDYHPVNQPLEFSL